MMGFVIPTLYTLFELRETVFVGIPDMKLAQSKWMDDFLPTIEASPNLRSYLPIRGEGSKRGAIKTAVRFTNGRKLQFLSAGQGDAGLAGFTTRNLVLTEVDKYDTAGEKSRETDPVGQMEARTAAFASFGRKIILECTVSITEGRIWQEIVRGTDSRIVYPCCHCGEYVAWEREHFTGWQEASDELTAGDSAYWQCPKCEQSIDESQRQQILAGGVLVHRGQRVEKSGEIIGDEPHTETFSLRWSPFQSPLKDSAWLGRKEWKRSKSVHQVAAEKETRQFIWCIPWEPEDYTESPLTIDEVTQRIGGLNRGIVQSGAVGVSVGIDTGKRHLHWTAISNNADESGRVIDYGIQPVDWEAKGIHQGLLAALRDLSQYLLKGWQTEKGERSHVLQCWIDSGYPDHQLPVYEFCKSMLTKDSRTWQNAIWRPSKGASTRHKHGGMDSSFRQPKTTDTICRYIGQQYYFSWQRNHGVMLVHANADYWKDQVQTRFRGEPTKPGAISLFDVASQLEHDEFCRHIVAEEVRVEMTPDKGEVVKWQQTGPNHFLDSTYGALAAGDFLLKEIEVLRGSEKKAGSWFGAQKKKGGRR